MDSKQTFYGLESLFELYRIGRGPSSSHTMGPERACITFSEEYKNATKFKAVLYGSLAKTGKGHGTDVVIEKTFPTECEVVFDSTTTDIPHPNTLDLFAYNSGELLGSARFLSVGGGKIIKYGQTETPCKVIYPHNSFSEIYDYCKENNLSLPEYCTKFEGANLDGYLEKCWLQMKSTIREGLKQSGVLPGGLMVNRKAGVLYNQAQENESDMRENRLVCAYAFAVSEQNAAYETIVTAPTCGASGVLPSVLYFEQQKNGFSDKDIINALKTGGIIGNLVKKNASISGAECGCQAEIGTACAMASAALAELKGLSLEKIEYAAEIAIEHHLGLTCDPICGLVQIPCIERNAVAACRARNAVMLAGFLYETRKISFDKVVTAMKETGRDMSCRYKETAEGGLANINFFD